MDAAAETRITAIDAVRGVAVLGILLMNIVSFSMPIEAYDNPAVFGSASATDLVVWAANFAIADGKMRGLFTLLFGASVVIIADNATARGEAASTVHYRRMMWLLVIGMLHGSMIWYGDILVNYALTGAILFFALRWKPSALFYAATVLFLLGLALSVAEWRGLIALKQAALASGANASDSAYWQSLVAPDAQSLAAQVTNYRGGIGSVMQQRLHDFALMSSGMPFSLIESLGIALFGVALYRTGYFTRWSVKTHYWLIIIGYGAALPLAMILAALVASQGFDPITRALAAIGNEAVRPLLILAHASLIISLVIRRRARRLIERLSAVGKMALTNYLATSILMTTLFYGTGLGLFGTLSRAALYPVVGLMWLVILLWSKPWLAHFRHGPAEWAWRSLARGAIQPIRSPNRQN